MYNGDLSDSNDVDMSDQSSNEKFRAEEEEFDDSDGYYMPDNHEYMTNRKNSDWKKNICLFYSLYTLELQELSKIFYTIL